MNSYPPIPSPQMTKEAVGEQLGERFLQRALASKGKMLPWAVRQLYAFTGWIPGQAKRDPGEAASILKRFEAGPHMADAKVQEARVALEKIRGRQASSPEMREAFAPSARRAQKKIEQAQAEQRWANLTGGTIPGAAKALVGGKAMSTIGAGWHAMPTWAKGLTGYLGYTGARDVMTTPSWQYGQPGFPYKSRMEHAGKELGANIGFLASGGMPLLPMFAASTAAEHLGGLPGRLSARRPPTVPPEVLAQMQQQAGG